MCFSIHQHDDRKPHAYFGSSHNHNKKYEQLRIGLVVHFAKSDHQKIDCIEHEFDAHEYDNGIAAHEHTHYAKAKQGDAKK